GHWEDPAVADRLGSWTRAAAGWHEAHRLRIARFGDNMREVAVTDGDKVEAQARFGFAVNGYGVADLVARVDGASDADVDRILKVMAEGLPGGTSFMEDYTYHLGDPIPEVLGAHMLEVCPSIAGGRPSCEIHPLSIGGRPDPVRLVFDAEPGPALVVGLADLGDRFRLITNEVEVVEPDAPLPRLPVARAVWRPKPDLA